MNRAGSSRTYLTTIIGVSFWGLSGTAAQALFQIFHFPVLGLLTIRLLCSGAILLTIFRPSMPSLREYRKLIPVAIFGFVGSQFTYLAAIQNSNAATATLLQFLFLPIVATFEALTGTIRWSSRWTLVIALSTIGTLLLIGVLGSGSVHLLITEAGLLFGLLAAASAAFYALYSRPIVRDKGPWWLTTWGFLLGGAVSSPLGVASLSSYSVPGNVINRLGIVFLVVFVIIFGTMLAYGLFLSGLQRLSATEVGVISSFEPIMAAVASYAFLGVILTGIQYFGGALIIMAVVLIAVQSRTKSRGRIPQP